MTFKNNYDQSSTGVNIELSIHLDGDHARWLWEDSFTELPGNSRGFGSTGRYWYSDNGELESPDSVADCIDWTVATVDNCKAWLTHWICSGEYGESEEWLRDSVLELYGGDWIEAARDAMGGGLIYDSLELASEVKDDFASVSQYFTVKYGVTAISGYRQGDYAEILYDPSIWSSDFNPREYFQNLFYDCPIYARVEIDGEEYYLDQELADPYTWDKREAEKIVRSWDIAESAKQWIVDNLPEYLEYVG